jgi:hypothetical protein
MSNGMSDAQMKQILENASGVTGKHEQSAESSSMLADLYSTNSGMISKNYTPPIMGIESKDYLPIVALFIAYKLIMR